MLAGLPVHMQLFGAIYAPNSKELQVIEWGSPSNHSKFKLEKYKTSLLGCLVMASQKTSLKTPAAFGQWQQPDRHHTLPIRFEANLAKKAQSEITKSDRNPLYISRNAIQFTNDMFATSWDVLFAELEEKQGKHKYLNISRC